MTGSTWRWHGWWATLPMAPSYLPKMAARKERRTASAKQRPEGVQVWHLAIK